MNTEGKLALAIFSFLGLFSLAGLEANLITIGGDLTRQDISIEGLVTYSILLFISLLAIIFILYKRKE